MFRYLLLAVMLAASIAPASAQRERAPQPPTERTPQPPQRSATVRNNSQQAMNEIYSSSTNNNDWGQDHLGADTLAPGASHRISYGRTRDCTFDFKIVYADGATEERRNVNICQNSTVAFDGSEAVSRRGRGGRGGRSAQAGGSAHSVELANGFDRTIYAAYLADEEDPSDSTSNISWSDDLFGSEMLEANNSISLNYTGQCTVRLRIVFDNFAVEERAGINICDDQAITVRPGWTTAEEFTATPDGQQADPNARSSFRMVNQTGEEILIVYANRDGVGRGPDRLGSDVLPDGESHVIRVGRLAADRCLYTVTIVYSGPRENETRSGINLCQMEELVISDGWTTASDLSARRQAAAVAPSARTNFRLVNRAGTEILTIYADRDGADHGPDRLGNRTLPNGRTFTVNVGRMNPAQCLYTVTIVYAGRRADETREGINLCTTQELVIQDGWQRTALRSPGAIRNGGQLPIVSLYVHAPNAPRGEDRLSNRVLSAGETFNVPTTAGQCQQRVVGIFRDGREVSTEADLCSDAGVTLQ